MVTFWDEWDGLGVVWWDDVVAEEDVVVMKRGGGCVVRESMRRLWLVRHVLPLIGECAS